MVSLCADPSLGFDSSRPSGDDCVPRCITTIPLSDGADRSLIDCLPLRPRPLNLPQDETDAACRCVQGLSRVICLNLGDEFGP